jgi:hypothetical protein
MLKSLLFAVSTALLSCTAFAAKHPTPPTPTLQVCDWSHPGAAPYKGQVSDAVKSFQFPADVQAKFLEKLKQRPSQVAVAVQISEKGIFDAQGQEYSNLRDMHWRGGLCVGPVTGLQNWGATRKEPGLVYSVVGNDGTEYSILVPSICHNVALISKASKGAPTGPSGPGLRTPPVVIILPPEGDTPLIPSGGPGSPRDGSTIYVERSGPSYPTVPETPVEPMPPIHASVPPSTYTWINLSQCPGCSNSVGTIPIGYFEHCAPIPEPETWALMLAGLGIITFVSRRKKPQ